MCLWVKVLMGSSEKFINSLPLAQHWGKLGIFRENVFSKRDENQNSLSKGISVVHIHTHTWRGAGEIKTTKY